MPQSINKWEQSRSKQPPRVSAGERIEHELGEDYVARHRREVLEEETPKIREQTTYIEKNRNI